MSLRDDIDAMERHADNGTLKEWFEGTAPILDIEGRVIAPSIKQIFNQPKKESPQ